MGALRLITFLAGGGAAVLLAAAIFRGKKKTPEQNEKERRMRINSGGRITDGTVIDATEAETGGEPAQLVIYTYDVGGVTYEASQDVTHLRHLVDLHNCRIGLPASVKYDPYNPGNSIVIAEGWTGLRL
jgi:hypothetical protein